MSQAERYMAYEACYQQFNEDMDNTRLIDILGDLASRRHFIEMTARGIRNGLQIREDNEFAQVLFKMVKEDIHD